MSATERKRMTAEEEREYLALAEAEDKAKSAVTAWRLNHGFNINEVR